MYRYICIVPGTIYDCVDICVCMYLYMYIL